MQFHALFMFSSMVFTVRHGLLNWKLYTEMWIGSYSLLLQDFTV